MDNANVGMPDMQVLGMCSLFKEVTRSVASFFVVFGGAFMVKIHGQELNIAGMTVSEYLATTSYDPKRIAVERNGNIVFKSQYDVVKLEDGDRLEIINFVGGG